MAHFLKVTLGNSQNRNQIYKRVRYDNSAIHGNSKSPVFSPLTILLSASKCPQFFGRRRKFLWVETSGNTILSSNFSLSIIIRPEGQQIFGFPLSVPHRYDFRCFSVSGGIGWRTLSRKSSIGWQLYICRHDPGFWSGVVQPLVLGGFQITSHSRLDEFI